MLSRSINTFLFCQYPYKNIWRSHILFFFADYSTEKKPRVGTAPRRAAEDVPEGVIEECGHGTVSGAFSDSEGTGTAAGASDASAAFAGTSGAAEGAAGGGELAGAVPAFDQASTRFGTINLRQ